jgi:hypothetical protein
LLICAALAPSARASDTWQSAGSPSSSSNTSGGANLRWRAYQAESPAQAVSETARPRNAKVVQAQWVAASQPLPNPFADEPDSKNQKPSSKPPAGASTEVPSLPPASDAAKKGGPIDSGSKSSSNDPFSSDVPKTGADRNAPAPMPAVPGSDLGTPFKTPYVAPAPLTGPATDSTATVTQSKCDEELALLKQNTIDKVQIDITPKVAADQQIPGECTLGDSQFVPRLWPGITYTWKASALCHKPLYFEEPQLERYGHSRGPIIDPLFSAAHFFVCVPLLPYNMGVEPPHECIYSLGYYRPGSCAPWIVDGFPISLRGLALECTAATGAAFAIP